MTNGNSAEIKKNKRKIYLFLIYKAIALDYFFFYAIDSIYYNEVKSMTFSEISLIVTIFSLCYMIVSIPLVSVVRKLGTVRSSQLGTFFYLISALMIFINPLTIYISQLFFAIGLALKGPSESKILKDNLKMFGLSGNYSKYTSIVQLCYAFVGAGATFASGYLYSAWCYAPIVCCCGLLAIGFVMSFFIKNEKELYKKQNHLPLHNTKREKFEFFKLFKYHTTWLLFFFSAIMFALIACSMDINKMVFQELAFSTITITAVITVARIVRGATAFGFGVLYKKLGFKSVYIVLSVLLLGTLSIGLGGLFTTGTTALLLLGAGTVLLYCTRDPFSLIREDFVMNSNGLTKRQTLLQITNLGSYTGRFVVSLVLSYILLSQSAAMSNLILLGSLMPLCIVFSLLLHRKRKINKYDVYY